MGGLWAIFIVPVRALVVLMAIASASLVIAAAARRGEAPFNPFAGYADMLPGNAQDAVEHRGFMCSSTHSAFLLQETCSLTLETGTFSEIQVNFAPDGRQVGKAVFIPRGKMLALGDLVALWGKPETAVYSGITNFRWRDVRVVAIPDVYDGRLSYWMPIRYVAFEGDD